MHQKMIYHLMIHLCYVGIGLFFANTLKIKGIKFFDLCHYNGIIFRVSVYSGQPYNDIIDLGQTGVIVLQLAHDFVDKGYSLFVDNY